MAEDGGSVIPSVFTPCEGMVVSVIPSAAEESALQAVYRELHSRYRGQLSWFREQDSRKTGS